MEDRDEAYWRRFMDPVWICRMAFAVLNDPADQAWLRAAHKHMYLYCKTVSY